ncbi:MAG: UDP-N-acetylglucosamine 1-carboxyvinyltransferase [Ruminococcaceae bacterium]|nr:UDP-N-acetylglucosamine 1-carboxyvinyltransferase [Oscillospiraceae bacterium]
MEKIVINGGAPLNGSITIGGMKNAALPVIFASILVEDKCVIENLPNVSDVTRSLEILEAMGAVVERRADGSVSIDTTIINQGSSPAEIVGKLRASTYLLGAELARFGKARVGWPGGCDFGIRPIDQHEKGFERLGATVSRDKGAICLDAGDAGLCGNSVYLDFASVGATINVMLAAAKAKGKTIIDNAAREPHIVAVASFLNACGAKIFGAGTSIIKIEGVEELHGCNYAIIPDMIEAGTYMVAAAAAGGSVEIKNVIPKHLETVTSKLREMGVDVDEYDDSVVVSRAPETKMEPVNIKTLPYPGFPTDMHPQFAAILTIVDGTSKVTEGVWDNRFRYTDQLRRMGANISIAGKTAIIDGVEKLHGTTTTSVDLRGGAAVVIAALAAEGKTEIGSIQTLKRGYDDLVGKLKAVGADIEIIITDDDE